MAINFKSIILVFSCLVFILNSSVCQSKFEFGLGIGINHSSIDEDIKTQAGRLENSYKGMRLPVVMTRIGYKINDKWHVNSGPGLSWVGALQKDLSARVIASTLELPVQLEWNAGMHIQFSSGPVYNYILGIKNENDSMDSDLLPQVHARNQLGLRHGIAFSYDLVELSLHYSHYLSDVFNFALTDVNGNFVGTLVSRFGNIQLGIIIRR